MSQTEYGDFRREYQKQQRYRQSRPFGTITAVCHQHRRRGLFMGIGLYVNNVIGGGIFFVWSFFCDVFAHVMTPRQ
jgi:hypothetical protein